jgi:hypothetical protein
MSERASLRRPTEHSGFWRHSSPRRSGRARGGRTVKGNGPTFVDAMNKLQARIASSKKSSAKRDVLIDDGDDEHDSYAPYSYWSKKNTLDLRVETKPIGGAVGTTVELLHR